MFTHSLRVYHECQESLANCPGLQTGVHGSQKGSRRRLAADNGFCRVLRTLRQNIEERYPRAEARGNSAALRWATFLCPLRGRNRCRVSGSLSGSRGCNPRIIVPNTIASRQRRLRSILLPFQGAGIVGAENAGFHPTLFYPSLSGTRAEIRLRSDTDLHFPFSILHFAAAGSACLCAESLWFSVRSLIQTSEAALAADKPCGRVFHTPRGDRATLTAG